MRERTFRLLCAALLCAGCAVHSHGLVHRVAGGTTLETPTGKHWRLVLAGDARPLAYLDGNSVEIHGRKTFGTVAVTDWKVDVGIHGLPTFVGTLESRGVQVGMVDRNTGGFVFVDDVAADTLSPYVGQPALVEGWVDGPQHVHVQFYQVLSGVQGNGGGK